jgi:hypothetical protein
MSEIICIIFSPKKFTLLRNYCDLSNGEHLTADMLLKKLKPKRRQASSSGGSLRQRANRLLKRLDALERSKQE